MIVIMEMIQMSETWSNKALHRTAICDCVLPWGFSFISQVVAVGELGR